MEDILKYLYWFYIVDTTTDSANLATQEGIHCKYCGDFIYIEDLTYILMYY